MKDWYLGLQPRERWILLGGGAVALAIIVWIAGIAPLRAATTEMRDSVAAKQRLLVNLGRIEGTQASASSQNGSAQQSLVVLIDGTAKDHGLSLPRKRPNGADGLDVTVQDASFDSLVGWLITLERDHSVTVDSATFSTARQPGLVNGQLSLHRT